MTDPWSTTARYAIAVTLVLACVSSPRAGTGSPEVGVSAVVGSVGADVTSRVYTYRYRVSNPRASAGAIATMDVEVTRSTNDPASIAAPPGWLWRLDDYRGPLASGAVRWIAGSDSSRIAPDGDLDGFQISSRGRPAIRVVELGGEIVARTRSVGPSAASTPYGPMQFVNELIAVLDESRQLGWISARSAHLSLREKLTTTKRALAAHETPAARSALQAFLDEVGAGSCHDFHCRGTEPLTTEAFALLFFNGEILLEQLPMRAPGLV